MTEVNPQRSGEIEQLAREIAESHGRPPEEITESDREEARLRLDQVGRPADAADLPRDNPEPDLDSVSDTSQPAPAEPTHVDPKQAKEEDQRLRDEVEAGIEIADTDQRNRAKEEEKEQEQGDTNNAP